MIRCRTCLIPDTRPDTAFSNGQCTACLNFSQRSEIDWDARKAQLASILESGHNDSGYDCIVPSSGGKDSHYQVLMLLELGARPLVVTASTCYLTPIGRANLDNLAHYATTIEVTPNRRVRAKLNKFGLINVGDISFPEHLAIFTIPFRLARQLGIPLIFYGESPQREYGCPPGAEEALTMDQRWVNEFGGLLGMRGIDCVGFEGITERDMGDYRFPELVGDIRAYFLGQFIPWDSRRNAQVARDAGMWQELPSQANWWPAENLDNAMTGLHDHMMYRKYGYGRLAAQLSIDIRNGLVSRDDALTLAEERDGLFPFVYAGVRVSKVCDQIGVSLQELFQTIDRFTDWSLFAGQTNNRPILKEFAERRAA